VRQLLLPFYAPLFPAPERASLTLLHAALQVTKHSLADAHAALVEGPSADMQHHAPIVVAVARLIVGRCTELCSLLDLYDAAVDDIVPDDDSIPF
jgi:hypothetical protein